MQSWSFIRRALTLASLRMGILYVLTISLILLVGWITGSSMGKKRAEAANYRTNERLQENLERNLLEGRVGEPFPDFPVWSWKNSQAVLIGDLREGRSLIVFLSVGCPTCTDLIERLETARKRLSRDPIGLIVVAEGDPSEFVDDLSSRGISVSPYVDVERAFTRRLGVQTFPTCFLVNEEGVVVDIATGLRSSEEFGELMAVE